MTRVAVVDDSEIELTMITESLRLSGIECYGISRPEDAAAMIKEIAPDLVVMDVHMPLVSGMDVCRKLKIDPDTRDIPVIMLTADSSADSIVASMHLGVIDYIAKPCAMARLVSTIKQHDIINRLNQVWQPAKVELQRIINKYSEDDQNVQVWEKERRKDGGGRPSFSGDCKPCSNYKPD